MSLCAAHLVDRVVPDVPLREFVLSLPHELRRLAAFKPASSAWTRGLPYLPLLASGAVPAG